MKIKNKRAKDTDSKTEGTAGISMTYAAWDT